VRVEVLGLALVGRHALVLLGRIVVVQVGSYYMSGERCARDTTDMALTLSLLGDSGCARSLVLIRILINIVLILVFVFIFIRFLFLVHRSSG
jgi:hypothetical protein